MRNLLLLGLVGFAAQLVDGALGMGYGVTSSSLLLFVGLTPAAASASVHLAEMGTTLACGVAHWRLRNVDWLLVGRIGVPGAVGAFAGATFLAGLSSAAARPLMAAILGVLGMYILLRYAFWPPRIAEARRSPHRARFLVPLGLVGGFVDATGGGGWGPVSTTSLLSAGKTAPRTVIGSVDTSEFLVSSAASVGFLLALSTSGFDPTVVLVLLAGGLVAAPLAAWLVTRMPPRVMGVAVGGLVLMTNVREITLAAGLAPAGATVLYTLLTVVWLGLTAGTAYRHRIEVQASRLTTKEPEWQI